jgi:hypothetical protein
MLWSRHGASISDEIDHILGVSEITRTCGGMCRGPSFRLFAFGALALDALSLPRLPCGFGFSVAANGFTVFGFDLASSLSKFGSTDMPYAFIARPFAPACS